MDIAIGLGIDYGGWIPRGRKTEDGPLHPSYRLKETESSDYRVRTRKNILDSDATLILSYQPSAKALKGGTKLTYTLCNKLNKPCLYVDLTHADVDIIVSWLNKYNVKVLNVAGPRISKEPDVYLDASDTLYDVFSLFCSKST